MSDSPTENDERTQVSLKVYYDPSAQPTEIRFFHNTFGLMVFDVEDGVASINPKWSRLGDGDLKDGFDRWITTGDVIYSAKQLPFVEKVSADRLIETYRTENKKHENQLEV